MCFACAIPLDESSFFRLSEGQGERVALCERTGMQNRRNCNPGDIVQTNGNYTLLRNAVATLALSLASALAHATVVAVDLGTNAPPATLGPYTPTPFSISYQNNIPELSTVAKLPSPDGGGFLQFFPSAEKQTVPTNWSTWSQGYLGPVFKITGNSGGTDGTLSLPPRTLAFYFYYEGVTYANTAVTVTTSTGAVIGPVEVYGYGGANGFGFYSDDPTEFITAIDVSTPDTAFAVAQFAVTSLAAPAAAPVPTLSQWCLVLLAMTLALSSGLLLQRRAPRA